MILLLLLSMSGVGLNSFLSVSNVAMSFLIMKYAVSGKYSIKKIAWSFSIILLFYLTDALHVNFNVIYAAAKIFFVLAIAGLYVHFKNKGVKDFGAGLIFMLVMLVVEMIFKINNLPFFQFLYFDRPDYDPTYLDTIFRMRGFAGESGNLAAFVNTLYVIAVIKEPNKFGMYTLITAICHALLVSLAGVVIFVVTTISLAAFRYGFLVVLIMGVWLLIAFEWMPSSGIEYFGIFYDALLLKLMNYEDGSAGDRLSNYQEAIAVFKAHPVGVGAGNFNGSGGIGIISLPLKILVENGLIMFIFLLGNIAAVFIKRVTIARSILAFVIFAHASIMGNILLPYFILGLAVFIYLGDSRATELSWKSDGVLS